MYFSFKHLRTMAARGNANRARLLTHGGKSLAPGDPGASYSNASR